MLPYSGLAPMRHDELETEMTFRKELAIMALILGAALSFAQPGTEVGPVASVEAERIVR